MKIETRTAYFVMSDTMGEVGPFWNKGMAESLLLSLTLQENRSKALLSPLPAIHEKSVQPKAPLAIVEDIEGFQSRMSREGFRIWHSGGGCTAWRYDVPNVHRDDDGNAPYILITNSDGCGHIVVSTPDNPDSWLVGLHFNSEGLEDLNGLEFATNLDLINNLQRTKLMLALAWEFMNLIYSYHTKEQVEVIRHLNALETDSRICHTHDFVDANQVMVTAFENVMKRRIKWQSDSDDIKDANEKIAWIQEANADSELMQSAWDFAKKHFLSHEMPESEQTFIFKSVLDELKAKLEKN